MQKILIATHNPAKLKEIIEYLSDLPIEFVSLQDIGITEEVEEDTGSYEGNSQKKAIEYAKLSGLPAISDDGGLEIAALGGAPGVDSHYFAGKDGTEEDIIEKMKQVLKGVKKENKTRDVTFFGVTSLALPTGEVWSTHAEVYLELAQEPSPRFVKGFPFRSFLVLPKTSKYFHESELTVDERNQYNHRYKALMKLQEIIERELKT